MAYENIAQIIKLAASTENTPELQTYWEKRYQDLLDRELFKISTKTLTLLADENQITKPATPFGDIVLVNHLDKNQTLDELTLQTTLESSVRFLDSLVDKINFTPEAKAIVNQYRKIGLGLFDFKEYVATRKSMSDLDEIDYIGSLVSSGSYRASESLAEEKGVCLNWNKIKRHLRPKSYEYWYEINTGEVKSGLEISEDFDQETIKTSNFEIIPRRNSNILLFPADLEWQIWSDRDSTAPKTEITHSEPVKEKVEAPAAVATPEPIIQPEPVKEEVELKPVEIIETPAPKKITVESEPSFDLPEEIVMPKAEAETAVPEIHLTDEQSDSSDMVVEGHELLAQMPETEIIPFEETDQNDFFASLATSLNKPEDNVEPVTQTQELPLTSIEAESTDPEYQIGELVIIHSDLKPEFNGKVYQVIDIIAPNGTGHDHLHYKLTGDDAGIENQVWEEFELAPVELADILGKVNTQAEIKEPIVEIKEAVTHIVHALILKDDKILLETIENNLELPGGLLPKNTVPEIAIEQILTEKYGITSAKTVYEVGTSITISNSEMPSVLHLGYVVDTDEINNPDLRWYEKKELAKSSKYVLAILAKLETQKKYFQEKYSLPVEAAPQPKIEVVLPAESKLPIRNITKTNLNIMSKYILKLEQLLQTESFGKVTVTLEYDSKGARLVAVHGDKVSTELETLLDTVLNLVNFSLGRNTTPTELAGLLEMQSQAKGPLGSLLVLVADVLKSAPGSILEISPEMIVDSLPSLTAPTLTTAKTDSKPVQSVPVQTESTQKTVNTKSFFGTLGN